MTDAPNLMNPAIITTLHQLGVYFIAGQSNSGSEIIQSPVTLLRGLASSNESRIRLALIPLFLKRPEYALQVENALPSLPKNAQDFLRCYYTAARLLQLKHSQALTELFGNLVLLPDLFEDSLKLDCDQSPDVRLQQLASEQARLTGKLLNWYGTYEHAYNRLVQHSWRRIQWQL